MNYSESTIRELVDNNSIYQLLTDKLDVPDEEYGKTFSQICSERRVDAGLMEQILKAYETDADFACNDFKRFPVPDLVNYLQRSHAWYLHKKLPEIEQTILQVFNMYQGSHKLLVYLCLFFNDYKERVIMHIKDEEERLFPYIHQLMDAVEGKLNTKTTLQLLEAFSVRQFLKEHSHIEDELQEVRREILKYSYQNQLPLPYKIFLNQLYYFEVELTRHAILEEEVLLPKVMEMEEMLLRNLAIR